jgi:hypothetical protein
MSHVLRAARGVLAALELANIRATMDPRTLHPPAVMVTPGDAERLTRTRVRVDVEATIVAPGPANLDALRAIGDLAAATADALDAAGLPWTEARFGTLDAAGDPLLTYTLIVPSTVEA